MSLVIYDWGEVKCHSRILTLSDWSKYKYLDSTLGWVTLPIVYPHPGRGHNKLFYLQSSSPPSGNFSIAGRKFPGLYMDK